MFDAAVAWVADNKEWLFSGAAVAAIAAILGFLTKYVRGRKTKSPPQMSLVGEQGSNIQASSERGDVTVQVNPIVGQPASKPEILRPTAAERNKYDRELQTLLRALAKHEDYRVSLAVDIKPGSWLSRWMLILGCLTRIRLVLLILALLAAGGAIAFLVPS